MSVSLTSVSPAEWLWCEMFEAVLRIVAPPAKRVEFLDVMLCLKGPTEVSRGCQACWVSQDANNCDAITYLVRWETQDELEAHFRSDRFRTILPYIEMSLQPPELEIFSIELMGGMDFLVSILSTQTEQ